MNCFKIRLEKNFKNKAGIEKININVSPKVNYFLKQRIRTTTQ